LEKSKKKKKIIIIFKGKLKNIILFYIQVLTFILHSFIKKKNKNKNKNKNKIKIIINNNK